MPDSILLPPLTPTRCSIPLLQATYKVLRTLARISTTDNRPQAEQLDAIFRNGIVRGFTFAGENARIAEELMRQICALVADMGVYAVRHLGDLVQIFGTVLGDPLVVLVQGYQYFKGRDGGGEEGSGDGRVGRKYRQSGWEIGWTVCPRMSPIHLI